jgi:hypothetical protein
MWGNEMGGGSGNGFSSEDQRRMEERAKQKLREATADTSRHVFICFAYEDLDEVNLLREQAKSEKTDLQFDDFSVKEAFDSTKAEYIKRQIREQIDRSSVTIVYLSINSATSKWVNWEIEESMKRGKGVIGVYKGDVPPRNLPSTFKDNGFKAVKWTHEGLKKAIEEASKKR